MCVNVCVCFQTSLCPPSPDTQSSLLLTANNLWSACLLSRVRLFATPWTVACQAPLSVGFPRQEYWSGLPFPSPGDLPDPGIKPRLSCISCIGRQILYYCSTWVPNFGVPHCIQSLPGSPGLLPLQGDYCLGRWD